jgi:hypothetical protein
VNQNATPTTTTTAAAPAQPAAKKHFWNRTATSQ